MAKGTPRQQYRAGTIALSKSLKQARMGEFRASQDALGTIFGNVATTQRGLARTLTTSNARKLAALQRLDSRTERSTRRAITGAQASASKLFGGVAAAGQGYLFDQGQGHAAAAATAQRGITKAGGIVSRGATEALGIQQAGAVEARAGADAMLADALRYRAQNDAQLIAERQNLILQSKLDYQNAKKMAELQQKTAEGAAGSDKAVVTRLATEAPQIAQGAAEAWRTANEEEGGVAAMNVSEVAKAWAEANGYPLTGPEVTLFVTTLRNLKADPKANTPQAYATAMEALYGQSKGWEKWGAPLIKAGSNSLLATQLREQYEAYYAEGGPGAPNPFEGEPTKLGQGYNDVDASKLPDGNYVDKDGVRFHVIEHQKATY